MEPDETDATPDPRRLLMDDWRATQARLRRERETAVEATTDPVEALLVDRMHACALNAEQAAHQALVARHDAETYQAEAQQAIERRAEFRFAVDALRMARE